jgi:hypothetical protein
MGMGCRHADAGRSGEVYSLDTGDGSSLGEDIGELFL